MSLNKITISCFFLFLISVGLITPQIANAGMFFSVCKGIDTALVGISKILSYLTASLLGWIISPNAINLAYTPHPAGWGNNNTVVDAGWKICRDLANMLVVLGFVVIAIATILRFGEYEAKKLLPKLIIVAILINFSPVICGLVIDASNITMNFFMKGGVQEVLPSWEEQSKAIDLITDSYTDLMTLSGTLIFGNVVGFLVFGLLFFLFLMRYVMLWILVIFSPIAFVCYVFPFTNQYFKQWWDQFLKWCIMGIPAAFTLYLASMSYSLNISRPTGDEVMAKLFTFMLPAMIMLVGFFYTLKFSGAGAAIAMGAMAATGSFALGAITGGAKGKGVLGKIGAGLGNVIGGSRPVTAAREALGGGLTAARETLGLAPKGASLEAAAKRRGDAKKRLDNMTSDELAKYSPVSGATRAARTEILAGRGNLDKLGNKKGTEVQRAIAHGVDRSIFEKADPVLTMKNPPKPSTEDLTAINKRVGDMNKQDIRKVDTSAYSAPQFLGALKGGKNGQIEDIFRNAPPAKRDALLSLGTGTGRKQTLDYARTLKAGGHTEDYQKLVTNLREIRTTRRTPPSKPTPPKGPPPPPPRPSPTTPPPPGAGGYIPHRGVYTP